MSDTALIKEFKILYIEDNSSFRENQIEIFKREFGNHILLNALEELDDINNLIKGESYDAAIIDYDLKDYFDDDLSYSQDILNGCQIAQQLKTRWPDIKIGLFSTRVNVAELPNKCLTHVDEIIGKNATKDNEPFAQIDFIRRVGSDLNFILPTKKNSLATRNMHYRFHEHQKASYKDYVNMPLPVSFLFYSELLKPQELSRITIGNLLWKKCKDKRDSDISIRYKSNETTGTISSMQLTILGDNNNPITASFTYDPTPKFEFPPDGNNKNYEFHNLKVFLSISLSRSIVSIFRNDGVAKLKQWASSGIFNETLLQLGLIGKLDTVITAAKEYFDDGLNESEIHQILQSFEDLGFPKLLEIYRGGFPELSSGNLKQRVIMRNILNNAQLPMIFDIDELHQIGLSKSNEEAEYIVYKSFDNGVGQMTTTNCLMPIK